MKSLSFTFFLVAVAPLACGGRTNLNPELFSFSSGGQGADTSSDSGQKVEVGGDLKSAGDTPSLGPVEDKGDKLPCDEDTRRTVPLLCGGAWVDDLEECRGGSWHSTLACDVGMGECKHGERISASSCRGGTGAFDELCVAGWWEEVPCQLDQIYRANLSSLGVAADKYSIGPALSGDGTVVVFESVASNLVEDDGNGENDIFRHHIPSGSTERVSVDSSGREANGRSSAPTVSATGALIAFQSTATNLDEADADPGSDIYVRDVETGLTRLVSASSNGEPGNGPSYSPALSADGTAVAFSSAASNLVEGDMNGKIDVFVRQLSDGTVRRVSVDSTGGEVSSDSLTPAISANGRRVAFSSVAEHLDESDRNGWSDIFLHDIGSTLTMLVSGGADNRQSTAPAISAEGSVVAYTTCVPIPEPESSRALCDTFVRILGAQQSTVVSVSSVGAYGNAASYAPSLSADGKLVTFYSLASNLVVGDSNLADDIFLYDLGTAKTTRLSLDASGTEGELSSLGPQISADGGTVAFWSNSANLVVNDANGASDIFVVPTASEP